MSLQRCLYGLPIRLRSIFQSERVEADLDDEVRDHIERQVEANVAAGMSPVAARTAALAAFGRVERHKEAVRDTRGIAGLEHFVQDVRFAVRVLHHSPGFTLVAVPSLALGIGGSSAIFGIVQTVFLRPLPYPHADRVVTLFETDPHGTPMGVSKSDFQDWRRTSTSFVHLAAAKRVSVKIDINGKSTYPDGAQVSPELFAVFGIAPLRGSVFTTTDRSVVISAGYWRHQFGGAYVPRTSLLVRDTARIITAIMPAAFSFPSEVSVWTPQDMIPHPTSSGAMRYWSVVGDLRPGITTAHEQQEMGAIARHLAETYPGTNAGVGVRVRNLAESVTGDARPALQVLATLIAELAQPPARAGSSTS